MRVTSFATTPALEQRLRLAAQERDMTKSAIIRQAIRAYLARLERQAEREAQEENDDDFSE